MNILCALYLCVAAVILVTLAGYGWRRRSVPGAREFAYFSLITALYVAGYALELTQRHLDIMLLLARVEYLSIAYLPACWLIFSFVYCGYGSLLRAEWRVALFMFSTLTLVLYLTTNVHGLMYLSIDLDDSGPFPTLTFKRGVWYWVHFIYLNCSIVVGNVLFIRQFRSALRVNRRQALTMMLASFVPWVTLILHVAGAGPRGLDLNPFGLSVTGFLFAWGVYRQRLLDFAPVARYELVEALRDPVLVFDDSGRLVDHNRAACGLFGAGGTSVGATTMSDMSRNNPALGEKLMDAVPGAGFIYRDQGQVFSVSQSELRTDAAHSLKLCLFHDVTGQVRAEEALRAVNATLEERVAQEVAENRKKEQILAYQARCAAMGEMIAAIAHQWRQPLSVVSAHIQNLKVAGDLGRLDAAFLDKTVTAARLQCEHMSATIEEFHGFFRPDKVREQFDVREKVVETARLFRHQAETLGITLTIDNRTERPVRISGYPGEFKQVIINLLANAGDAIRERRRSGGAYPDGRIVITLEERGDEIAVTVSDNGSGIPEAVRESIFDPYFTTKRAEEGTGIGLYYCKLLVESSMGGLLRVSDRDGWTRFILLLPGGR